MNSKKNALIFNRKGKQLKTCLALLEEMGRKEFLMPLEEIRLGNQFADLRDSRSLKNALLTERYLTHENFHVKRVIAITFRRLEKFDDKTINQAMQDLLYDSASWVIYDAIWYFKEAKTTDEQVIQRIRAISEETKLTKEQLKEKKPSSDPTVNMKWMAEETLEVLK